MPLHQVSPIESRAVHFDQEFGGARYGIRNFAQAKNRLVPGLIDEDRFHGKGVLVSARSTPEDPARRQKRTKRMKMGRAREGGSSPEMA